MDDCLVLEWFWGHTRLATSHALYKKRNIHGRSIRKKDEKFISFGHFWFQKSDRDNRFNANVCIFWPYFLPFFTIIIQTLVPPEQTVDICLLFDKILSRLAMYKKNRIEKVDLHYILFEFWICICKMKTTIMQKQDLRSKSMSTGMKEFDSLPVKLVPTCH